MSQLQSDTLTDFTGGLNLRRTEFSLAQNESPDLLNVEIDERIGFATRRGWERWNAADVVGSPTGSNWDPKHAYVHPLSDGDFAVYIANGTTVYVSSSAASFSDLSVTVGASPHLADFASWGDICYIATGSANASQKQDDLGTVAALTAPGSGTYNDDYTTPAGGYMPKGDFVEGHAGYLFVASIIENATGYPNRLRWSHPDEPEDWAELDFLDINIGGGRITGLKSFQDHLVIFKEDSVWALYGYDRDSWQLVRVSRAVGCPHPGAITRSPGAVFFYTPSSRSGIYLYSGGGEPEFISDPLQEAFDALSVSDHDQVYVGWTGKRLWVSIPWNGDESLTYPGSVFVLDPAVGEGAWTMFRPALGKLNGVVEGGDVLVDNPIGVMHGDSGAACIVKLDATPNAFDDILASPTQSDFEARYRTRWVFADTPELRKGWLRPRFICGLAASDTTIDLGIFHDYNESAPARSQYIDIEASGADTWNGTTWNGGTWNGAPVGSLVTRTRTGSKLGNAKAVSLRFSTNSASLGERWSISGIEVKYRARRYTT